MDDRTKLLIKGYVAGELDEAQCTDLEALALRDEEVADAIEAALKPTADAFREAYPLEEVRKSVDDALRRAQKQRRPRALTYVLAAVAACTMLFFFWPRGEVAEFVRSQGSVIVEGKTLAPGSNIPFGVDITAIGTATLKIGETSVTTDPVVGVFRLENTPSGPRFVNIAGSASFTEQSRARKIQVAFSGSLAQPLGTRFTVSSPALPWTGLDVFEHRVEVTRSGRQQVVGEGKRDEGQAQSTSLVDDDPLAIPIGGHMKIPTMDGLKDAIRTEPTELPQDVSAELEEIASDRTLTQNSRLWKMSALMAASEEPVASAHLATAALDAGLDLQTIPEADIWRMVRFHSRATGDGHLANLLLSFLQNRASNKREITPYLKLTSLWNRHDGAAGQAKIEAAREIDSFGNDDDALVVAEGLIFGYQDFQDDKSNLVRANEILDALVSNSSVPQRTRAVACQRHGEATYFLGPKRASIPWTMRAIGLWPVPKWKVHVGTRMAECDAAPLQEALKWIDEGLIEDPTYYAYERTAVALYAGGTHVHDAQTLRDLLNYMGETFWSVPYAELDIGKWLASALYDVADAQPFIDRAVELYGDWKSPDLPQTHRNEWAGALWRAGRQDEARSVAFAVYSDSSMEVAGFYAQSGQWEQAAACMERTPGNEQKQDFLMNHATALRHAGHSAEAAADYEQYIKGEQAHYAEFGRWREPGGLADALVSRGELISDKEEKARLAIKAIEVLKIDDEMSANGKNMQQLLKARAQLLLGNRDQAIETVKSALNSAVIPVYENAARQLLDKMESNRSAGG